MQSFLKITSEERRLIIEIARKAIETWVRERKVYKPRKEELTDIFSKKLGVFVTIHRKSDNSLRGCIGFPYPILPLIDALINAAIEATRDPRFPELSEEELSDIKIEVSILSPMEEVYVEKREELPKVMRKDRGYVIKYMGREALFLPQVWKEIEDPEEFLANLCFKAMLPPDTWLDKNCKVYEFSAEIIEEE
jgi:AmmeMemoRadiSam system protein A